MADRGHKYVDKYQNSRGNWTYVYPYETTRSSGTEKQKTNTQQTTQIKDIFKDQQNRNRRAAAREEMKNSQRRNRRAAAREKMKESQRINQRKRDFADARETTRQSQLRNQTQKQIDNTRNMIETAKKDNYNKVSKKGGSYKLFNTRRDYESYMNTHPKEVDREYKYYKGYNNQNIAERVYDTKGLIKKGRTIVESLLDKTDWGSKEDWQKVGDDLKLRAAQKYRKTKNKLRNRITMGARRLKNFNK